MEFPTDRVVLTTLDLQQPQECDAVVIEQDTFLLLGVDPVLEETATDIRTLAYEIEQQEPLTPGSVLVSRGKPLQLTAIVYDIEHEPMCDVAWIDIALTHILNEIQQRELNSVCMPMLGIEHGRISPKHFLKILDSTLQQQTITSLTDLVISGVDDIQLTALLDYKRFTKTATLH